LLAFRALRNAEVPAVSGPLAATYRQGGKFVWWVFGVQKNLFQGDDKLDF
jgi:hypothetical protein